MALTANAFKSERFQFISGSAGAPGAGLQLTWPVPDNRAVEIQSIIIRLTTDINVADRLVFVQGRNLGGASNFSRAAAPVVQGATLVRFYAFSVGILPIDYGATAGWIYCTMPCCLFLQEGESFFCGVNNIQAGDVINGIELRYFSWKVD